MASLKYHVKLRDGLDKVGPTHDERKLILCQSYKAYQAAKWRLPEDFLQKTHYERVVCELDWNSSPGYPYMLRAPSNKDLFGVQDGKPDIVKVNYIWQIVEERIKQLSPPDHVRLFIKPEPHKIRKLENERYRLISSVSVVDQIIDHMLFGEMNKQLIANWSRVPNKAGWSPVGGGWRHMPREKWLAIDKSGWDWSVHIWYFEMSLALREMLCENVTDQWKALAKYRYESLFLHPTYITTGGLVMRQKNPGVMKSGCVNTIADNSIMQWMLHCRVCNQMGIEVGELWSMGDDTLQEPPERLDEYLEIMGRYSHVKQYVLGNEFAGFKFEGARVEPMYKGKHAYTLLHVCEDVLPQLADSYTLNYHRSDRRNFIESLFQQMGLDIPLRIERDIIYDGY